MSRLLSLTWALANDVSSLSNQTAMRSELAEVTFEIVLPIHMFRRSAPD